ncbi:type-1 histone deacetylase 1-like [Capsicum chacoense]
MAFDKSTIDIFENPLNNLFPFLKYGATLASPYALLTLNYCLSWVYPDLIGHNKFIRVMTVSFHKYGDKFFPGTGDMKSVEEFGNRADRMSIGLMKYSCMQVQILSKVMRLVDPFFSWIQGDHVMIVILITVVDFIANYLGYSIIIM